MLGRWPGSNKNPTFSQRVESFAYGHAVRVLAVPPYA